MVMERPLVAGRGIAVPPPMEIVVVELPLVVGRGIAMPLLPPHLCK